MSTGPHLVRVAPTLTPGKNPLVQAAAREYKSPMSVGASPAISRVEPNRGPQSRSTNGSRGSGRRGVASAQSLLLTDGRRLSVRRWPGRGDPVVILHGLLDSSEGWTRLCERVSIPALAFDLPGFGCSDPSRGSITGYAHDVAEGLALLGVKRFALVGHSLGGAVAAAVAEMMPSQVSSLVLLAPAGFGRIHLAETASIPGVRNVLQATLPLVLASRFAVTVGFRTMVTNGDRPDRDVVERVISRGGQLVEGAREGTRAVVHAGRHRDAFHRRRVGYDGPVLAVWGDRDRLVPVSHRHGVKTAFPQAVIHVWYGMGHHPLSERFDQLLAVVTNASTAARRPVRRKVAPATTQEITFRQRPSAPARVCPGGHGRLVAQAATSSG